MTSKIFHSPLSFIVEGRLVCIHLLTKCLVTCRMSASPNPAVNGQRVSVIRATTDSPMSPPPMSGVTVPLASARGQSRPSTHSIYSSGPRTVLDFLISSADSKPNRYDGRSHAISCLLWFGISIYITNPCL